MVAAMVMTTEASVWRVGFQAEDISPTSEDGQVCLGGFGVCTCRAQTGVHDAIFARALYLGVEAAEEEALFVVLDVVGMSNRFIRAAVSRVAEALQMDPDRVVLSSTHSHSTPDLAGLWGGVSAGYRAKVLDGVVAAARGAKQSAVTAQLRASKSSFALAGNRRGWETTDQSVLVLWAVPLDAAGRPVEEEVLGALVNYAAHPVFVGSDNTLVARDWPDGLIDALERRVGAGKAVYVNGAQGDVSPSRDVPGSDSFEKARSYGALLAATALAAMDAEDATEVVQPALVFTLQRFSQCVVNQQFLLAVSAGCMDYDFYSDSSCPRSGILPSKKVDTQVAYVRLGVQVQLAIVPGEATTRMAIDGVGASAGGFPVSSGSIKSAMSARFQGIFGLSTDFLGYFIPQDEWNSPVAGRTPANKDYEEGVSLGGPDANTWMRDRIKSLIEEDQFQVPSKPSQWIPNWWH